MVKNKNKENLLYFPHKLPLQKTVHKKFPLHSSSVGTVPPVKLNGKKRKTSEQKEEGNVCPFPQDLSGE